MNDRLAVRTNPTTLTVFGFYEDSRQVYISTFHDEISVAAVIRKVNHEGVTVVAVVEGAVKPVDALETIAAPDSGIGSDLAGDPECPLCAGHGWANCRGDNSFLPHEDDETDLAETIQRCDICAVFETDRQAWEAARAAGWEIDENGRVVAAPEGKHPMPILSARAVGEV